MIVKTRFAPSPTGNLHIGGVRTAIFNWAFARKHGGKFYLRIDDTDDGRNVRSAYDQIIKDLTWIGLNWDVPDPLVNQGLNGHRGTCLDILQMQQKTYKEEWTTIPGIVYQSLRGSDYLAVVNQLIDKGVAYHCFLSKEELEANKEKAREQKQNYRCDDHRYLSQNEKEKYWAEGVPHTIRLNVDAIGKKTLVLNDLLLGDITCDVDEIEDFVLVRPKGKAMYALATVVDDIDMQITHIIRGQEHLTNTFKQMLIFYALGVEPPTYLHIPFITAPNSKKKLSKRCGIAATLQDYRESGYLADALFNYLSHLGWAMDGKAEIWDRDQFIQHFEPSRLIKSSASFDPQKLLWVQSHYMSKLPTELKAGGVLRHLGKKLDKNRLMNVIEYAGDRIKTFEDIRQYLYFFDDEEFYIDEKAVEKRLSDPLVVDLLSHFVNVLRKFIGPWTSGTIQTLVSVFTAEKKLRDDDGPNAARTALIHALRVATTGTTVGIGVFEGIEILGQSKCCARIDQVLNHIQDQQRRTSNPSS